ncbi:MAG: aminopeptidase P family N-terminal domain-containing protein [Alphaproteobacteria bacterium]
MRDKKNRDEDRLTALRAAMKAHGVQGFLVPRADEFQGEFVAPYAERLKWLTGFTGSAGLALILEGCAAVLTDARYTLQITRQIDTHLYEALNIADITAGGWLADHAPEGAVIGYDPWLHTPAQLEKLEKETVTRGLTFKALEHNLLDEIWSDQPALPKGQVSIFPEEIAGLSSKNKRAQIGQTIEAEGGACAIISLPDSLCWLLNVRGADIDYTPSVLSYGLIRAGDGVLQWFIDPDKLSPTVRAHLGEGVEIVDIADMPSALERAGRAAAQAGKPVFLDHDRTPVRFKRTLEEAGARVQNRKDPCIAPKAIKTSAEQKSRP